MVELIEAVCDNCSGTELSPACSFDCPAILAAIQEMGPLFSSTNLYVDNIEQIAGTVIGNHDSQTAFSALSSNIPTMTALKLFSSELKLRSLSHMDGLWPCSTSQVKWGSQAMKEPNKKPSRESNCLNRKCP
ncbi:hypothetical protein TNCV_393891 [Trichonephila clavipes]|nr:hypothetical protein TNCV_393891 [Trichonephila clavipes]